MSDMPLGPLMVDVEGAFLTEEERKFLLSPSIGAVILFTRNFSSKQQVRELISDIKSLRNPSLLIAVDQEGGEVQRFKKGYFKLPAVAKFGERYEHNQNKARQLSRSAGRLMATELIEVGVDFSFAPVLDRRNSNSLVIGDRAFHEQVDIITDLAGQFINGMNSTGMSATGKHFPGHGGVKGDSHLMKPVDSRSLDELRSNDLVPFQQLAHQLGGIMTAHVEFSAIHSELPTFSTFWINQVLRKELGFSGVVFSDDLSMKGAHHAGDPLQRTKMALNAGCDMALICNDPVSARFVAQQISSTRTTNQARLNRMRPITASLTSAYEKALIEEKLSDFA